MEKNVDYTKNRYNRFRKILIFWTLFIGIGAVAGSVGMLADPTGKAMGMDAMLPYFQVLPFADVLFQDFIFSGIMLLLVNGITNLVAAIFLFAKKKIGVILGMTFGITLMLWICIQFCIFPFNFMSTIYFVFGLLQFITGYACLVFYKQTKFEFDPSIYQNIAKNPNELVVFFSRMGYVKKVAYEKANELGAEVLELKTEERTKGTLGFLWCGRFAMHSWGMKLLPIDKDLSSYSHITICSPVWDFKVSAPIREFIKENKDKLPSTDFVIVHYLNSKMSGVIKEIKLLADKPDANCESICCHVGKFKKK